MFWSVFFLTVFWCSIIGNLPKGDFALIFNMFVKKCPNCRKLEKKVAPKLKKLCPNVAKLSNNFYKKKPNFFFKKKGNFNRKFLFEFLKLNFCKISPQKSKSLVLDLDCFKCLNSLDLMKDPIIVATGQVGFGSTLHCLLGLSHWIQLYLNRTSFTLGELVSLVKVFRLFRMELDCFGVQSVDTVGRCTTSYLLAGPACLWCLVLLCNSSVKIFS